MLNEYWEKWEPVYQKVIKLKKIRFDVGYSLYTLNKKVEQYKIPKPNTLTPLFIQKKMIELLPFGFYYQKYGFLDPVLMLKAVKKDGRLIQYLIDDPSLTEEMMLEAVKQDGNAIEYISYDPRLTEEMMLEAIESNPSFIEYLARSPNLTQKVMLRAIQLYGGVIKYLRNNPNLTEEMKQEAIRQNDRYSRYF